MLKTKPYLFADMLTKYGRIEYPANQSLLKIMNFACNMVCKTISHGMGAFLYYTQPTASHTHTHMRLTHTLHILI